MTDPAKPPTPHWIALGGLVLALGYLPTLVAPFDFVDDGNLVYPSPPSSLTEHARIWWDKVRANVDHLGPFRPTLWAHWEVFANTLGPDPVAWRAVRLVWCGLAAGALLWLMHAFGIPPAAALLASAAAMWNPYRNEIWTSLTLAEGVAMPYALGAIAAARQAATSRRPAVWDAIAVGGLLVALGCKNTFVAIVPAMLAARLYPDGWRANRWRAAVYLLPLLLPAGHFVYFRLNWQPGQYTTPGPSWEQAARIAGWLRGGAGLDFIGVGLALGAGVIFWSRKSQRPPGAPGGRSPTQHRPAVLCGALLLLAGVAVYLPVSIMAARYTLPAVWGFDLLFALLLARLLAQPAARPRRLALAAVAGGLAVMAVANVARQEKLAARSRMLWAALYHVETTAPADARIAWASGDALNAEEGIHFAWHLRHRGRPDIRVGLFDADGRPIPRVELPPLAGPPALRVSAAGPGREFAATYRFGRKRFSVRVDDLTPAGSPAYLDPSTLAVMRQTFDADLHRRLTAAPDAGKRPTAELKPPATMPGWGR
jgi:hypothetical protein